MKRLKPLDDKGSALILVTFALMLTIGTAGLAIDSGRLYGVKARLSAAVDAAGVAAARAISDGDTEAGQAAMAFFEANYPDGYFHSTPDFGLEDISIAHSSNGNARINLQASADVPTTFMRILGYNSSTVGAAAEVLRRAADVAFVVDNSTSLMEGDLGDVTEELKTRSIEFVDNFSDNFDRLALIKYGYGAEVPVPFTAPGRGFNRTQVNNKINAFTFKTGGESHFTNCAEGFWRGLRELNSIPADQQSSLRVIVFFTDGAPNTFSSRFEFTDTTPKKTKGSIRAHSGTSGRPVGLWRHKKVYKTHKDMWDFRDYYAESSNRLYSNLSSLPNYYNAWNTGEYLFKVVNPSHPLRPVENHSAGQSESALFVKISRISRNLVEDMAKAARQDGIHVFTLGLGSRLKGQSGPDREVGEDLLLRMANDPRADTYNPDASQESEGIYCHAATEEALAPCFELIVQTIIRLNM